MADINGTDNQFPSSWAYSIQKNRRALATYNGDVFINGAIFGGDFSAVANVQTSFIPAAAQSIVTLGYYTAGDGGGASYVRVGSAGPGTIQSADGQNWGLAEQPWFSPKQFGAKADGGTTDNATALQAANDRGITIFFDPDEPLSYGFGRQVILTTPFIGGGKVLMLTGAGKFDASTYAGGYATNKTGFYINAITNAKFDLIVEMQANAAVRTCNAMTIQSCINPDIRIEAFGFKEANYGIIEWNSNLGGSIDCNVHDCGANSTSLASMQITGLAIDGNRTGVGNSIGNRINGYFKNIRLGAAAGAFYNEQTDGLNIQTTGYSGAIVDVYAENVGEPFDCFGDNVVARIVAKNAVNYGVKIIHGASDCIVDATVDGCGIFGVVIGSDSNTKSCNRNVIRAAVTNIGTVATPVAPPVTAAFSTDGISATFQPTNNTITINAAAGTGNPNYVCYLEAGSGNMIEIDGSQVYTINYARNASPGANNIIRRRQNSHVRAYMGVANTATNNTTVAYDTEVYDPTNEYNPATGIFTANCAGRFHVKAQIRYSNMASLATAGLAIDAGPGAGTRITRFVPLQPAAGANELWVSIDAIVNLQAGEQIKITCLTSAAGAQSVTNTNEFTWLEIEQI